MVHWFQAGSEGAVIDDYSSTARDLQDGFTNPGVVRETEVVGE
jgi:D-lyxose ketol-isomerase